MTVWNRSCNGKGVLRITVNAYDGKVVLKLEGRLAGPWVDELRKTVLQSDAWRQRLEIDVSGLTFAEEDGEKTLIWLRKMGARFQGKGPFPEYLFERLKLPLSHQETSLECGTTESPTVHGPRQAKK